MTHSSCRCLRRAVDAVIQGLGPGIRVSIIPDGPWWVRTDAETWPGKNADQVPSQAPSCILDAPTFTLVVRP